MRHHKNYKSMESGGGNGGEMALQSNK